MSEAKSFVVKQSEIKERFDPFYYLNEYREMEKKLEKLANVATIGDISVRITDGTHEKTSYVKDGVPLLRVQNISEDRVILDDVVFITKEEHEKRLKRTILKPGDVLLTKDGRVGTSTVFTSDIGEANLSAHVARLVLKSDINPYYVSTFLNTRVGQLQIERKTKGVCSRGISLPLIGSIKIPLPPREIQDKISQIVQEAYKRRKGKLKEAERVRNSINDYVLEKLGIDIPEVEEKRSFIVRFEELNKRHDPFHYLPKFATLMKQLKTSKFEIVTLKKITKKIAGGATPKAKSDAYTEDKGIPFLRIQNIGKGYLDLTDVKYIKKSVHNTLLRRSQLKPNDVLFTITGRIGTTAVVPEDFGEANINQHMVKMELKNGINPHFVECVLNSAIGQVQAERKTTGTTRIALDYPSIKSIEIPLPPIDAQNEIIEGVRQRRQRAEQLKQEAEQIVKEAKEKVEKMIFGD